MKKNDVLTAEITNMGSNCEGIAKVDGIVCFIPFSLLGEKVEFKVLKVNKNIAFCKLLDVLTPSEDRVRPLCKYYKKCGGCQLQHVKQKTALKIKSNIIKDCFKKIANIDVEIKPAVKGESEYYYRNKIQLPIRSVNGENKIGFFYENSHRIVEIDECVIQKPIFNDVIKAFNTFIRETSISCFNEDNNTGLLKHVVVRDVKGKLLIIAVLNGKDLPFKDRLIDMLNGYFKEYSLILNENTKNNNVILGDKFTVVFGQGFYYDKFLGIKYPVFPESFMQVNDSVKERLYVDVIKRLELDENRVVIDAYSGAGIMTAMMAKTAKKAIGIEVVPEAVKAANELAVLNNLSNKMSNICALCEVVLPDIIAKEKAKNSAISVVLDPPRKGCDDKVLSAIIRAMPDRIVYVACSPQSLARDVGILLGSLEWISGELKRVEDYTPRYEIESVTPYDMFSATKHIETLVSLKKIIE